MSSLNVSRRSRVLAVARVADPRARRACFRPLYGPTASGEALQTVLAAIEVDPVTAALPQERVGHYLRSELIFDLNGSGVPAPKRYKLSMSLLSNACSRRSSTPRRAARNPRRSPAT